MQGNAAKDSRWFSFWDFGVHWDQQWHSQALLHSWSLWREGRSPWTLQTPSETGSDDAQSVRTFAWNAPEQSEVADSRLRNASLFVSVSV